MSTEKPRFSITVDQNLSDAIDDYKYRTRAKNQTQAVVELIERGLDSIDKKPAETKNPPAPEGTEGISMERSNRLYDALIAAGLIVDDNLAPEDMKFLMHIVDVIEDWFARKQAQ